MNRRDAALATLHRDRPRSRFLRTSAWLAVLLTIAAWLFGGFLQDPGWTARRAENLQRFLGEIVPYPLQGEAWDWSRAAVWAAEAWRDHLGAATAATLAVSVAAILLAGVVGALLSPWAARTFARPDPFLDDPRRASRLARTAWTVLRLATRALLTLLRSIPEYVWAFLLLALFGPIAWSLVLALALHNAGILGKLGADTTENLEQPTLTALRGLGAGRAQILLAGVFPLSINRFLLYLFYRWETCVREATVLGMLGLTTLGFWIQDARARNHYDEMVLALLCGAALVVIGDLVSAGLREAVRRA